MHQVHFAGEILTGCFWAMSVPITVVDAHTILAKIFSHGRIYHTILATFEQDMVQSKSLSATIHVVLEIFLRIAL